MKKSFNSNKLVQRIPLTRERILNAALELADNSGLDSVSMRKVAQSLGVEAMSLYKYVANKDDLLDGIVELVVAQMSVPSPDTAWREALRARAYAVRKILNCHPWAANLLESRVNIGPTRLRHHDSMFRILRNAGFSIGLSFNSMIALTSYVYGFVILEEGNKLKKIPKDVDVQQMIPPAEYPYIYEMIEFVLESKSGNEGIGNSAEADSFADFEFGLNHLFDGLERMLARGNATN